MENESDELTWTGFRKWVITNFSELKEHVLTQCKKKTKNLEKRFDKMLTRINRLERNINELMELKKNHENFVRHTQVSIAKSAKQKKGYIRDWRSAQWNKMRRQNWSKMSKKKMNKASKKYGIKGKELNYIWYMYLNVTERMNPSWKTHFRILSRRTSPT